MNQFFLYIKIMLEFDEEDFQNVPIAKKFDNQKDSFIYYGEIIKNHYPS